MEQMRTPKWEKTEIYCNGYTAYELVLNGIDESGRNYFYTGKITKIQNFDFDAGKIVTSYDAEYQLFTDGNNFRLKPDKGLRGGIRTVKEAKAWIEEAFRNKWSADHEDKIA